MASNLNTPAVILEKFADGKNRWGGYSPESKQVAMNPSASESTLEKLANQNDDTDLQERALRNPSTPITTLERFATGNRDQRIAVAQNESTPVTILTRLAVDDDLDVQAGVAENWSTPADVLVRLAK